MSLRRIIVLTMPRLKLVCLCSTQPWCVVTCFRSQVDVDANLFPASYLGSLKINNQEFTSKQGQPEQKIVMMYCGNCYSGRCCYRQKFCCIKIGNSTDFFELLVEFIITLLCSIMLVKSERSEFPCKNRTRFITKLIVHQTRQDKNKPKTILMGKEFVRLLHSKKRQNVLMTNRFWYQIDQTTDERLVLVSH